MSAIRFPLAMLVLLGTIDLRADESDLRLELQVSSTRLPYGHPVYCRIVIHNNTDRNVDLFRIWDTDWSGLQIQRKTLEGDWVKHPTQETGSREAIGGMDRVAAKSSFCTYSLVWANAFYERDGVRECLLRAQTDIPSRDKRTITSPSVAIRIDHAEPLLLPMTVIQSIMRTSVLRSKRVFPFEEWVESVGDCPLRTQLRWRKEFQQFCRLLDDTKWKEAGEQERKWRREMDPVHWGMFQLGVARELLAHRFADAVVERTNRL